MERRVGGRDMGSGGSRKFGERGLVDEDAEWMGAGCKKIKKL